MTYSEFEKLVLRHIDQYSVAGDVVPDTYNNQIDDRQRIVELCNIALRTIATQGEKITDIIDPDKYDGKHDLKNGWTQIDMPSDFYAVHTGIPKFEREWWFDHRHQNFVQSMHYRYLNNRSILVPTRELHKMLIEYFRFPRTVRGNADEVLDCSESAAQAASYYVASQLVREENAYLYQALNNEFESMMARLEKPISTEYSETEDVYGF